MRIITHALLAAAALQSVPALAGLGAPTGVSSTGVLPVGISNPRITTIYGSYGDKLNGSGDVEPTGSKLAKVIRWKDAIKVQRTEADRTTLRNLVLSLGFTEESSPGESTSDVNVSAVAFVPTFAFGVTDRLTLGVGVPILRIDVSAATGFVKNNDAQKVIDAICNGSNPVKCGEIKNQFATAVDQMTRYYGYESVRAQHTTAIGDVHLVGKYRLWNNHDESVSVAGDITAPTGTRANPDKIIDVATGDGQWDLGTTVAYNRKRILGELGFGVYGGYTLQTADRVVKRIPMEGELLDPDKEEVSRNLGDVFSTGAGLSYEFLNTGISLSAGYHLQYQTAATYQGIQFSDDRYRLLEGNDPSQTLHSASLSAGYSTVGFFQQGKALIPLEANLSYGRILAGRNVSLADRIAVELVLYF